MYSLKKIFPHIMCIIITVIICIFITNQSGEIFSQGTEDIIVDYEQGQIDDYLEYRDTFFLQVESDESLSPEMANQLPVRGNADRSGRPEIVTYTVKKVIHYGALQSHMEQMLTLS